MSKLHQQEARALRGMCKNCGTRPPKKRCSWGVKCLRTKNLTQLDRRVERVQYGLCPRCGLREPLEGRSACRKCLK